MAGNGALDLSIRIMGKVDPSLVTAIKQTKGLTGDLANALTGTKSLGSTVANTLGVIGKTGLGIMATLTTASAVKKDNLHGRGIPSPGGRCSQVCWRHHER